MLQNNASKLQNSKIPDKTKDLKARNVWKATSPVSSGHKLVSRSPSLVAGPLHVIRIYIRRTAEKDENDIIIISGLIRFNQKRDEWKGSEGYNEDSEDSVEEKISESFQMNSESESW